MSFENLNFYTVSQVSAKLRIPEEVIMELICEKNLEAFNIGGKGIFVIEEKALLTLLCKSNTINNDFKENSYINEDEGLKNNKDNTTNIEIDGSDLTIEAITKKIIETVNNTNLKTIEEDTIIESSTNISNTKPINTLDESNKLELNDTLKHNKIKPLENNSIKVCKSHIVKHKDGYYIPSNKLINEEDVIVEFIFDKEQAKKPISEEIVFSKLGLEDNVHICDDQEANQKLLNKHTKGNGV